MTGRWKHEDKQHLMVSDVTVQLGSWVKQKAGKHKF